MFCNPEVLNPDHSSRDCSSICSELQNHHVSKPVAELSQAQIHNSSVCESTPKVLQSTKGLSEEQVYPTVTNPTSEKLLHQYILLCYAIQYAYMLKSHFCIFPNNQKAIFLLSQFRHMTRLLLLL